VVVFEEFIGNLTVRGHDAEVMPREDFTISAFQLMCKEISPMRTFIKDLKNIMWLCRPYLKYGRLYLALSIIVSTLYSVLDDVKMSIRKIRFLLFLFLLLSLPGCSQAQGEDPAPPSALSAATELILPAAEGSRSRNILQDDTLYYTDWTDGGGSRTEIICRKTGEEEPECLAEFPLSHQMLFHFLTDQEGAVYYLYCEAEPEEETMHFCVYLRKDSSAGNIEFRIPVQEAWVPAADGPWDGFPQELENLFAVNDGAVDREGHICLYSRNRRIFLFDSQGCLVQEQETPPADDGGLVVCGGSECYFYYTAEGHTFLRAVDMESAELSREEEIPIPPEDLLAVFDGGEDDILLAAGQSLFRYRPLSDGEAEHLFDWEDFSLSGHDVLQVQMDEEGWLILAGKRDTIRQVRIAPGEAVSSGEQVVTLGTLGGFHALQEIVDDFNAASPSCRIELREYSLRMDELNGLYLDLLKGEGPDIFDLYYLQLPMDVLAEQGILEDLTPYLERSSTIKPESLLPRVLEAGSHKGRLVSLIPLFSIDALIVQEGASREGGWTPEEFLAYGAQHPDTPLYKKVSDFGSLLDDLMAGEGGKYIDWESGTCSFDSEDFIRLLQAVREARITGSEAADESGDAGFLAGKYLVADYLISSAAPYAAVRDSLRGYGEFAGYPGSSGGPCYLLHPAAAFGLNSSSLHKEDAWAFLEYLMSEDFLAHGQLGFPARRDAFEEYLDRNLFRQHGEVNKWTDPFTREEREDVPVPEVTEEDKAALRFMADHLYYDDRMAGSAEYRKIIWEESGAFFAGEKSAEDAAALIQNRVSLLLEESAGL